MSEGTMAALQEALANDAAMRERFATAGSAVEIVRIAAEAGFEITTEDLTRARGELTEAELQAVAGGTGNLTADTNVVCQTDVPKWC